MKTNLQIWLLIVFWFVSSTELLNAQNQFTFMGGTEEGWTHPLYDLTGSSHYPFGSGIESEGIELDWQSDFSGNVEGSSYQLFTGDVTGDSNLEIVYIVDETLFDLFE